MFEEGEKQKMTFDQQQSRNLTEEDRKFLLKLKKHIELKPYKPISEKEYNLALEIFRRTNLLFHLDNSDYGFQICLCVYEPADPIYPGLVPEPVFLLHLRQMDVLYGERMACTQWEAAWRQFTEFSHSEENKKNLKWHNMPEPRGMGYYEY